MQNVIKSNVIESCNQPFRCDEVCDELEGSNSRGSEKKNFNEKKKTILPSQTDLLTMSYKNKTSKVN